MRPRVIDVDGGHGGGRDEGASKAFNAIPIPNGKTEECVTGPPRVPARTLIVAESPCESQQHQKTDFEEER